jgi:hypothetical protein
MGDSPLESTHSGFWLRSEARINFRNSVKLRILSNIAVGTGLSLALSAGGGAVSGSRSIQLHGDYRASTEAVNGTKVPVRGFGQPASTLLASGWCQTACSEESQCG